MNIPLNIDIEQILLHLLNFLILFAALYFLLYSPVKKFMDNRAKYYSDLDRKTKEDLAAAEKSKSEYETRMAKIQDEISEKRQNAEKEIARQVMLSEQQAKQKAEKIVENAKKEAFRERDRIIAQANGEIISLVDSAAEKLIFADTSDAYEKFLSEAEGSADND